MASAESLANSARRRGTAKSRNVRTFGAAVRPCGMELLGIDADIQQQLLHRRGEVTGRLQGLRAAIADELLAVGGGEFIPLGGAAEIVMAANFAVSAGSTLALRVAAGSLSLGAESVMPYAKSWCSLASANPNEYGYAPPARQPSNGRNPPPTKDPMWAYCTRKRR